MRAYIALGSNLDAPVQQLQAAIEVLRDRSEISVLAVSSFYGSPPVGDPYQGQPDYVNAVLMMDTALSAHDLLRELLAIEAAFGRTRAVAFASRRLDLDILLYGESVISTIDLTVPHPRMLLRAFVVLPLLEIAPDVCLPDGQPVSDYAYALKHAPLVRIDLPLSINKIDFLEGTR